MNELILVYLAGAIASAYIGARIEAWLLRNHWKKVHDRAWDRGFQAGRDYLDRIKNAKLDCDSAVKILEPGDYVFDADIRFKEPTQDGVGGRHFRD